MSRMFILAHQEARRRALDCIASAPDGYVVRVSAPTRSGEQNAALHARLSEISDRVEWAGRRWDIDTWKRLLVASWSRAAGEPVSALPALDGYGVDIVFRRTSQMTKRELSDLMDYINAWCSEQPAMKECES